MVPSTGGPSMVPSTGHIKGPFMVQLFHFSNCLVKTFHDKSNLCNILYVRLALVSTTTG